MEPVTSPASFNRFRSECYLLRWEMGCIRARVRPHLQLLKCRFEFKCKLSSAPLSNCLNYHLHCRRINETRPTTPPPTTSLKEFCVCLSPFFSEARNKDSCGLRRQVNAHLIKTELHASTGENTRGENYLMNARQVAKYVLVYVLL